MNKLLLFVLLLLLLSLGSTARSAEGPLPLGVGFPSPDGRYSVHVEEIDKLPHFVIVETGTGRVDKSIVMPTRLLYLHWAADSHAFVIVEHITQGSCGRLVYLQGDTWKDAQVDPPFPGMMFHTVVNLCLTLSSVHYKFVVTPLTSNWIRGEDRICDLDVSLNTGKMSNIKWSPVRDLASLAKLMRNPMYFPPMDYHGPRER